MRIDEPLNAITNSEFVALGAVLAGVVAVLAAALVVIVRRINIGDAWRRPPQLKLQPQLQFWEYAVLALAVAGLACIGYAYFIEPNQLETTYVKLTTPKLSGVDRPLRIVQLSDLHCEKELRLEQQIPQVVAKEKPDIIVFTGDSINAIEALPNFKDCMTKLAQIAPTFAVYGNHDARDRRNVSFFGGTGVKALNGKNAVVEFEGKKICISGVAIDSEWKLPKMFSLLPKDAYTVFLYHFPAGIEMASANHIDLCLTGHTHGGQVRLPFYGAVITRSKLGKKYEMGLYDDGETKMYVNRGIGMEGGFSPRLRFLCSPEITVIDVGAPGPS